MVTPTPPTTLEHRLDEWKQRLIDLTRRNRLLHFHPAKGATLTLTAPVMNRIFEWLYDEEKAWTFWLPPAREDENEAAEGEAGSEPETLFPVGVETQADTDKPDDELVVSGHSRKKLEARLKNIYRKARTDYQERGVRILFVAFGTLHWRDNESSDEVISPLVLCPVELRREAATEPFELLWAEEDIVINPALAAKLRSDFHVELPPALEEWSAASLTEFLKLTESKVSSLAWRVEETAHLGFFSFHKLAMYQDLLRNAAIIKSHAVVCGLAGEALMTDEATTIPAERELDDVQQPEETFQILDADSSQQQCIQAALARRNLVLQGPPGTGKSQTIANIIAEFLARGRTVLFVSEKMAALEVVFKRLRDVHLDDFCLELHSHKANKREVVQSLKAALDTKLSPAQLPAPGDYERLKLTRSALNNYVRQLHVVREPLGLSVRDALERLAALEDLPYVAINLTEAERLTPAQLETWESVAKQLANVWHVVEAGEDYAWHGCLDSRFNLETRGEWLKILSTSRHAISELHTRAAEYAASLGVDAPIDLAGVAWLLKVGTHLNRSPAPDASWLTTNELGAISKEAETYRIVCADYWQERERLEQNFTEDFFGIDSEATIIFERLLMSVTDAEQGRLAGNLDAHADERWLFERGREVLGVCQTTVAFTRDARRDIGHFLNRFGFNWSLENVTPERAHALAQVAVLCATEVKPEAAWLDTSRLAQVGEAVARLRPQYEAYRARQAEYAMRRTSLLVRYDESFLHLDLDNFIERFGGFLYRSPLRYLAPGFYKDKRAILRTSRTPSLAPTVLEDLIEARELVRLGEHLKAEQPAVCPFFGGYDRREETNFDSIKKALGTAARVLELAGANGNQEGIPHGLRQAISLGSPSSSELRATGERLEGALESWERSLSSIADVAPVDRLPGTELPFITSPLASVERWANKLRAPLAELCDLTDKLLAACRQPNTVELTTLRDGLRRKDTLRGRLAQMDAESARLRRKFGRRYAGINTTWSEVLTAIEWTNEMKRLFANRAMSERFIEQAALRGEQTPPAAPLATLEEQVSLSLARIEERFASPAPRLQGKPLRECPFAGMLKGLELWREYLDDLAAWCDFKRTQAQLEAAGLLLWFLALREIKPQASQLVSIYRKSIYQAWVDRIFALDDALGDFRARAHENVITEFRATDEKLVRLAAQRIVERCDAHRPKGNLNFVQSADSEISILRKEAAKQRRHLPVRQLFNLIPNLLLKLKPCLMMSPLSVSQFLQTDSLRFDLVIFDEASQIFTEDAVGAIYRGAQLIVAGDSKQMPPTDFFRSVEVESDDTALDDTEEAYTTSSADYASVLDECQTINGIAVQSLRWHYRSRHESLIAFSNNRFYDNRLVTFPAAQDKHPMLGLEFVHLADGVYDRGGKRTNQREAEAVANRVFEFFMRYPKKSLGVVAFSQAQMSAIEDEIERRRIAQPEYEDFFKEDRLEGFFVKNLENVQGDERDCIIFSVGYGRDARGQMTINFGPLNRDGGERRLNVAITRAREKVILVSSIKAADIAVTAATKSGVLNLQRYLDYAERGAAALALTHPQGLGEAESPLEADIAGEIRRMGYDAVPQVGCSGYRIDIGVVDPAQPGRFLLGVEADGATYHSAYTARDRDRLRQSVLEKLGWRIHRIWSPDWVLKRSAEIKRLEEAFTQARTNLGGAILEIDEPQASNAATADDILNISDGENETPAAPGVNRTVLATTPLTPQRLPGTEPYKVYTSRLNELSYLEFHHPACRAEQARLLREVVETESPVHIELAARRLAQAWGLSRVGNRMLTAVHEAVTLCERSGTLTVRNGRFLWSMQSLNRAPLPVRTPDELEPETKRDIKQIAPEEIQAAMLLVLHHAVGISLDSLINETRKIFGFNRSGNNLRERLLAEVESMCQQGLVQVSGDTLSCAD